MVLWDGGVRGFAMLRLCYELVNLIGMILIMAISAPEESKGKESFKDIFGPGFWEFICIFAKNAPGVYAEYLGFELITILLGIEQNDTWMAAWVTVQSIISVIYIFGVGFANTTRTIVAQQVGEGNYKKVHF